MLTGDHRDWASIVYTPVIVSHSPAALLAELPPQASVLDAGCHDGTVSCRIAAERPDVSVLGVDINPLAIAAARDRARREGAANAQFETRDILDSEFQQRFDAIVTIRLLTCFPHASEWHALLRAIEQRLVQGGLWFAIDYVMDENNHAYVDRYAAGERAGWRRGTFSVTTPSGKPWFIAHHHTEEELALFAQLFEIGSFCRFESRSMNGNRAAMFELIGRRRDG